MIKTLPNNTIRKAVYSALNLLEVDGVTIPCFDSVVNTSANTEIPNTYILMTTQSNTVDKDNKCESFWNSEIMIEVYVGEFVSGNTVSREFADNILNEVRYLTSDLELPIESGLSIITLTQTFPNDIVVTTKNQNVVRKFMRLTLLIE